MSIFSRSKKSSSSAPAETAATAAQASDEKLSYFDALDPETQKMMIESQKDASDVKPETFREFLVRSPFKLGFIVTLGGLLAIIFGQAVAQLSTILIYIVAAMFIALGLDPVVRWLGRKKIPRAGAIAIVFTGFSLLVAGLLLWLMPQLVKQVTELVKTAPQYLTNITEQEWFINLNNTVGSVVDLDALVNTVYQFVLKPENWSTLVGGLWQAGIGLANGVTAFIIIFILSLYFLASLQTIKRAFYKLAPKSSRYRFMDITEQVTQSIGGYISGMVALAAMSAVIGFIAMTIVGVPFAAILALILFGLGLIPLVGPLLGWSVVTVVSLFDSPVTAITIGIFALVYMQIEAYVLTPRVMNKAVSVPGSLVVIGAMAGAALLGLLGALIAIPVAAMILIIIKQVWMPQQDKR
jgi:predicted PurR-regulated permease PerM